MLKWYSRFHKSSPQHGEESRIKPSSDILRKQQVKLHTSMVVCSMGQFMDEAMESGNATLNNWINRSNHLMVSWRLAERFSLFWANLKRSLRFLRIHGPSPNRLVLNQPILLSYYMPAYKRFNHQICWNTSAYHKSRPISWTTSELQHLAAHLAAHQHLPSSPTQQRGEESQVDASFWWNLFVLDSPTVTNPWLFRGWFIKNP